MQRRVNGELALQFSANDLTSYSGLELVRRFLTRIDFSRRLRQKLDRCGLKGDYAPASIVRLILAMMIVGATRLRHVGYLEGDPVLVRFCGLARVPSDRTLTRWLSRCTASVRRALQSFQAELIALSVQPLQLPRVTLDVDGTVLSTGLTVERAFRGYNPHRRKVPSYFPITAHLAQTGHVLRVQNRSGNVHDGKASKEFLRDLFGDVAMIAPGSKIEIRMDGAFFRQDTLRWLSSRAEFAIKVPFYQWLDLQSHVRQRRRWKRVAKDLDGFDLTLPIKPWNMKVRVAIYRKRVMHKSPKNYQLNLFDPSDGHWEYSAVATEPPRDRRRLQQFRRGPPAPAESPRSNCPVMPAPACAPALANQLQARVGPNPPNPVTLPPAMRIVESTGARPSPGRAPSSRRWIGRIP